MNLNEAMTVGDLINKLKAMDPNMPVAFGYNYSDYWQSAVAQTVRDVDEIELVWSDYHNMWKRADADKSDDWDDEDDDNSDNIDAQYAVVIF